MANASLPEEFKRYFWDVDTTAIDPLSDRDFVIKRLLDRGNQRAVDWALKHYEMEDIKKVITTYRDMSPRTGSFWGLLLDVAEENIPCMRKPYQQTPFAV